MAGVPGTSAAATGPLTGTKMDTEDMDKDSRFEEGIEDMLNDFFCDILSVEDIITDEEAKKRQEHEDEIKEQCSKLLYEGARVSRLRVLLGLLNLQTIYGWSDVNEGGSFSDAKLEYSSTSTDGSASESENRFLNAFELDTNTDQK
ncbi:hypothetical protein L7F22_042604 [Adiantum nelumboides]|nr:hypothetical protein [Adiantum nelumboides]